ncbi:putative transporter [uncultured Campylobacter sp.]|uniref:putative transporter n=1 Tax=uncultured Campylobacter sp. TaxID=218934 RepID=UPI00261C47EC|nr:putative transporter [uncultured Campylobacter sp.]
MFKSFYLNKKFAIYAYGVLAVLILFIYTQIALTVALNEWYRDFYDILQAPKAEISKEEFLQNVKDANNSALAQKEFNEANFINKASVYIYQNSLEFFTGSRNVKGHSAYGMISFYHLVMVFLSIALPYVLIYALSVYIASLYALKWREAMTFEYIKFWKEKDDNIEGSSQRIQEDCYRFSKLVEDLGIKIFKAFMTLLAFLPILYTLSDPISKALFNSISDENVFSFLKHIDGFLVYLALFVSLGGLLISWFVGIKLPGLEYNNQKAEAAFRKELVYAEDNRSKYASDKSILELFTGITTNYKRLFLHYGYFNIWLIMFEQSLVILPFLIVAPSLFSGVVGLGIVMQMNSAFDNVRTSFSVFILNWTMITELRSVYKRLKEFEKNVGYK